MNNKPINTLTGSIDQNYAQSKFQDDVQTPLNETTYKTHFMPFKYADGGDRLAAISGDPSRENGFTRGNRGRPQYEENAEVGKTNPYLCSVL
ncbi:unnamed protein product [Protopolystoma xenopodis]|uniref:Uncharacterized protein n=1 Tax=Protopolystoma xenopodis TaxID=117903 RepID=A0A448WK99_9PLAT|nr:unnamed protein product [Protopolystoma xenopodis]